MLKNQLFFSIFADGDQQRGAGHQVRMAALAAAMAAAGHRVRLCCRDLPGSTHGWAWAGQEVHLRSGPPAEALRQCAADRPDALVVDHYEVAGDDLDLGLPVLAVDDVPGRDLRRARLVLNQNLGVAADCYGPAGLVGPTYALLRPAFHGVRWQGGSAILVMLGGTDHRGLAGAVCRLLLAAGHTVRAVGGRDLPDHPGVERLGGLDAAGVAAALASCRAAVLGAGSAVNEALAVGTPFAALHTVANQDRIAAGLAQASIAPVLVPETLHRLPSLIPTLIPPPPLVDGHGAHRVVAALESACPA